MGRDEFLHARSNIKVTVWNEFSSVFIYPILFLASCFYVFFGGGGGLLCCETVKTKWTQPSYHCHK